MVFCPHHCLSSSLTVNVLSQPCRSKTRSCVLGAPQWFRGRKSPYIPRSKAYSFQPSMLWRTPAPFWAHVHHAGLREAASWTHCCTHLRTAVLVGEQDRQPETVVQGFHAALQISRCHQGWGSASPCCNPASLQGWPLKRQAEAERGTRNLSSPWVLAPVLAACPLFLPCPKTADPRAPVWIHHHKNTLFAPSLISGYW